MCVCVCFGYFLLAAEMEKNTDNDVTRPWSEERNAMESSVSAKLYANISSRPVSKRHSLFESLSELTSNETTMRQENSGKEHSRKEIQNTDNDVTKVRHWTFRYLTLPMIGT